MPHYKDGTKAEVGDIVKGKNYLSIDLGVVLTIQPSAQTCNFSYGRIASLFQSEAARIVVPRAFDINMATCGDFEKIA